MSKTGRMALVVSLVLSALFFLRGCGFSGEEAKGKGAWGHLIPGRGERGFDPVLEDKMERYFLTYKTFSSAPFGMSLDAFVGTMNDRRVIERFVNENPHHLSFKEFCIQDPECEDGLTVYRRIDGSTVVEEGIIKSWDEWGDLGMFGGVAAAGEFFRYAVLKEQGYPADLVEEARSRCIQILQVLHIAHTIHGFPGYIVRGLKPKETPPYEVLYGFTVNGEPYPKKKGNTMRDDMTGLYPEWSWMDSASGDQFDGWLFLMGVAWDIVRDDPEIPQYLKDQLVADARRVGDMLMTVSPESGTDMLIRDADGRLTQFCNVHPNVVSYGRGCPEFAVMEKPTISFEAIMGLGFIRVLYHITGDEKLRAFYYDELIQKRQWHNFIFASPWTMADMGYATNFSNVNMVFIAYYNAIRYESDPAIRANLQRSLETVLWDNGGIRQPKEMHQPWYDFIYAALRAGGHPQAVIDGAIQTLQEWPEPPNFNDPVINCDANEIAQGWCLAVDNDTIIQLPPPEFRFAGGGLVAEQVVPRRLRGHSNFDWRSNPYEPNRGGNPLMLNPNGEMLASYWMGRYMKKGSAPDRNISPIAVVPGTPAAPGRLVAVAISEQQINLMWSNPDHLESSFSVERRTLPEGVFAECAVLERDVNSWSDVGLSPNTTYEYRVRGVNPLGASPYSPPARATTFPPATQPPASAINLIATPLDHQSIRLQWSDMSNNEIGFKVLRADRGLIATTLANVTEFTDTGLQDNTTYTYLVISYNSAGSAWPSNEAWATTAKLPSIFAISPEENAFQVPIDVGQILVGFGDPVQETDVKFELRDEVGVVEGAWTLDGSGTVLTFVPELPLLTMSTTYTVKVTVEPVTYVYHFTTEGASWTVNIEEAVNQAFALSIFDSEVVEPAGAADLLAGLGLDVYLILGVLAADTVTNEMTIIGALGNPSAPNPRAQDKNQPTLLFPQPAKMDNNPEWSLGPFDLPINIEGFEVVIQEVTLSGIFERDYNYSGKGEFRGGLDLRPLAVITGLNPEELCLSLGVCSGCPAEPERVECINLYLRNMRADRNPEPVEPIAQVITHDLGGSTTVHTLELSLTHPATGAAQAGIELKVSLTKGNGLVNGGSTVNVTTGPEGKATVMVTDIDGGTDDLQIEIVTPVSYSWVKSKFTVVFSP